MNNPFINSHFKNRSLTKKADVLGLGNNTGSTITGSSAFNPYSQTDSQFDIPTLRDYQQEQERQRQEQERQDQQKNYNNSVEDFQRDMSRALPLNAPAIYAGNMWRSLRNTFGSPAQSSPSLGTAAPGYTSVDNKLLAPNPEDTSASRNAYTNYEQRLDQRNSQEKARQREEKARQREEWNQYWTPDAIAGRNYRNQTIRDMVPQNTSFDASAAGEVDAVNPFIPPAATEAVSELSSTYNTPNYAQLQGDINATQSQLEGLPDRIQQRYDQREATRYTDPYGKTRHYDDYQEPAQAPVKADASFLLPNGKTVYVQPDQSVQEAMGYDNPSSGNVGYKVDGGSVSVPAEQAGATLGPSAKK